MTPAARAYVVEALKELDRRRFLATLPTREPDRGALQSLWAFGADVAAVPARVNEPAAGEIRLQWWVDALSGAGHGDVRHNPIADALLETLGNYHLPVDPLVALIEARRFDLYHDPMPDLPSLEGYAGATVSVLFQLGAMVLARGPAPDVSDAAGHLGVAEFCYGHVAAFGHNASRGKLFLPKTLFEARGASEAAIFSGQDGDEIRAALRDAVDLATDHEKTAVSALGNLDKKLRPAFAQAAFMPAMRAEARRAAAAPFERRKPTGGPADLLRLAAWAFRYAF